ncbi:ABC transporter substrate-binding protein [Paenibacillus sp. S150]|uniref:ABC transporter substrate-binding protein n=1 Tax=Paenibacillus sp. S150 TaxID=2749826 RepID=UPI001C5664A7|nr:ABC transporter substrate-binding protein [Paenibacillus sp. S150]MBW4083648.1 ABC transporter substrate-binding protein [Paenibacillus sp. S150]
MRKARVGSILSAVLLLAFTVACSNNTSSNVNSSSAAPSNSPAASEAAKEYKDELKVAITAQPPTLDPPTTVSGAALEVAFNLFEQLYTLDANYEPQPVLAESYTKSEDGLTYTFKLRQGVKFHNGKELTSDDVVASMNRWLVTSSKAKVLLADAKFSTVDSTTAELKLATVNPYVIILIASQSQFPAIMPKEVVEAATADGITEYIGTGPYKLQEWKKDQYIHLVRNDDYVGVDSEPSGFSGHKDAATPSIYYYFVSDNATRVAGVKTGEYDIAESIPNESYDELASDSNVALHSNTGGALTAFLNTNEGPLKNVKVRQAILQALNDDEIMLASFAKPDLYTLSPSFMNPSQTQWASTSGAEYYNQQNQDKAKELLKEAGYNGEQITLLTTPDYSEMYNATLVIQEQLRQIGFNVEVVSYDFPTFLSTKDDHSKWDLFVASTGYQLTPQQLLAVTPGWAGLNNDTVKQSVAAISSQTSPEEAKKEWDKLQSYLYEQGFATVLGQYKSVVATAASIEGFQGFILPVVWNTKAPK